MGQGDDLVVRRRRVQQQLPRERGTSLWCNNHNTVIGRQQLQPLNAVYASTACAWVTWRHGHTQDSSCSSTARHSLTCSSAHVVVFCTCEPGRATDVWGQSWSHPRRSAGRRAGTPGTSCSNVSWPSVARRQPALQRKVGAVRCVCCTSMSNGSILAYIMQASIVELIAYRPMGTLRHSATRSRYMAGSDPSRS